MMRIVVEKMTMTTTNDTNENQTKREEKKNNNNNTSRNLTNESITQTKGMSTIMINIKRKWTHHKSKCSINNERWIFFYSAATFGDGFESLAAGSRRTMEISKKIIDKKCWRTSELIQKQTKQRKTHASVDFCAVHVSLSNINLEVLPIVRQQWQKLIWNFQNTSQMCISYLTLIQYSKPIADK